VAGAANLFPSTDIWTFAKKPLRFDPGSAH
jgi:hypothetical protein